MQFNVGVVEGFVNVATAGQYNGVKQAIKGGKIRVPHSVAEANDVAQNIDAAQNPWRWAIRHVRHPRPFTPVPARRGGSPLKQPLVALDERIGYSEMDTGVKHMFAGDPTGSAEFAGGFSKLTGTAAGVSGFAEMMNAPRPDVAYQALNAKDVIVANDPWIAMTTDLDVARVVNERNQFGIIKVDLNKVPRPKVSAWEIYPRVNGVAGFPYHGSICQDEVSVFGNATQRDL